MAISPRINQLVSHYHQGGDHGGQQHGAQAFGAVKASTHFSQCSGRRFNADNAWMLRGEAGLYKAGHVEILPSSPRQIGWDG
jgi:hypothetical protein